jgi:hypothetical protein
VYTQVESELVSIRAEWTQTIADLQCNLLMIFGLAIAATFFYIHCRGAWRAPNMRPIDNRGYQYDKKWVINDKQNAVMNGIKSGFWVELI